MIQLFRTFTKNSKNCCTLSTITRFPNYSSVPTSPELRSIQAEPEDMDNITSSTQVDKVSSITKPHSPMVAAVFASLHSENGKEEIKTPFTDKKLEAAKNVDELLSLSEGSGISRRFALKIVSILADWSSSGKIQLSEFETDPRFTRLCRILTKGSVSNGKTLRNSLASRSEDLSTVLSVTADDEAAKLVESITLPQMVKVMSTLSQKKRRSTLLLRALAYNISGHALELNIKQCGDLLYSMSTLNFVEDNLLAKIGNDICSELQRNIKKSSVIGSILTSIGLLKYKDPVLLDALSEWILENHTLCRPQDIFSFFMTLAVLNYQPENSEKLFQKLLSYLTLKEAGKPVVWLEIVWSLVLLNRANQEHIASVLNEHFLKEISSYMLSIANSLKLLNIDGAAQYMIKDYNGPRIPQSSPLRNTKIIRSKEKLEVVDALVDTLKNLIQSDLLLKTRINTGIGFLIDAVCLLDRKCNPLPLNEKENNADAKKVAILVYDYHDMTRGKVEPTGINVYATNILKAQGYTVLEIPYTDFRPRDKLISRVKCVETKLKELVKE